MGAICRWTSGSVWRSRGASRRRRNTVAENRAGHRSSTEGPSKGEHNQFNSGHPLKFSNTAASVRAGGVAFTGVITVRAHTRSSSDAVRHTLNVTLNK